MAKHTRDELKAVWLLAEQQMKRWALALQAQQRLASAHALVGLPAQVHPYVAISRQAGAGGGEVAGLVAERLECQCLDKELLTHLAQRYQLPAGIVELVDEQTSGLLLETLHRWLDMHVISRDEYVVGLGQIALMAARNAPAVFVGRGIQFLLPRDRGLAVRIIAPYEKRVERTMQRQQLDRKQAQAAISETDRGRRYLVKHHFHRHVADPRLYDLLINLERLDNQVAADIIVAAFNRRFRSPGEC